MNCKCRVSDVICHLPTFLSFLKDKVHFCFIFIAKKFKKISTNLTFKQPVKILGKFRKSLISTWLVTTYGFKNWGHSHCSPAVIRNLRRIQIALQEELLYAECRVRLKNFYGRIFVYTFCLINLCLSLSDDANKIKTLNIERA